MKLLKLNFKGFRNLEDGFIEPGEKVNVIYGENAQGKTNLLEAVWVLCGAHSFRGAKDSELVGFNSEKAQLYAEFYSQNRVQNVQINFYPTQNKKDKKEILINAIPKSAAELVEKTGAVVFSPEDLTLVKSGPAFRRKFIDSAICRQKVKYASVLGKYNKTLNQRNALLKDIPKHRELMETLEIWDTALCSLGGLLIKERIDYIKKLNLCAEEYHHGISSGREALKITYDTNFETENLTSQQLAEEMLKKLRTGVKEDLMRGYTGTGPHRDDVNMEINGVSARNFGSQGQQRSTVLSLKLAEARLHREITGENPIVLLDDVLSELDNSRQDYLLNKTENYQVFITCCEESNKEQLKNGRIFKIDRGKVRLMSSL